MGQDIKNIFMDSNFTGSLILVISLILLGFIFKKANIFKESGQTFLSKLLLLILIPCMAFDAFMCDFSYESSKQNISIFIFSFVIMFLLFILFQFLFYFKDKENYKTYSVMIVLGQMTLFTIPILKTIYQGNNEVLIASNMITLTFRLFLYIYAYLVISKTKINATNMKVSLKNIFLNPIMISMFLGLFIYLTQNIFFKVNINDESYSILRIDKTLPMFHLVISTLEKMTTPLAMLLVGMNLGGANLKQAFTSKKAYLLAFMRVILVPVIVLVVALITNKIGWTSFDEIQMVVLVLCFAAPLSAVVNTYCIAFNNQSYLASDVCFLSTFMAIIALPLFYVIVRLIF